MFTMVPKQRYAIMRDYLPTRGSLALDMMLRTSTVQANYDYDSEADAMLKMRVALKLSPLTTAMFARSAGGNPAKSWHPRSVLLIATVFSSEIEFGMIQDRDAKRR